MVKKGHSEDNKSDTSKLRNFSSLRGNFYYKTLTLKMIGEENWYQNKVLWLFLTFFR